MLQFTWSSTRCISSTLYNLFSVSSDTKENEYFTMSVLDNTALIEGRGANGEQFYDKYTDAPLKVRPGQWNSVTFTVEQPTTELPHGRVRLYVNGVLSRQVSNLGNFIKDMPDVNQAQLGATKRDNKTVWHQTYKFEPNRLRSCFKPR